MALRGTLTHRKTRRLAKLLKISQTYALGILESLWHVTAEQQADGGIGRMQDSEIAEEMFYEEDPSQLITALVESGWLDPSENCRLYVHDWHEHADDSIHSKLIQWTRLFANGAPPRLRKLSQASRDRVIHRYEERYGPIIGQIIRCVRTDAHEAHDAHGAHIQSQSPEPESRARVQSQSPNERTSSTGLQQSVANAPVTTKPVRSSPPLGKNAAKPVRSSPPLGKNAAKPVRSSPPLGKNAATIPQRVPIPDKSMDRTNRQSARPTSVPLDQQRIADIRDVIWGYMRWNVATQQNREYRPPDDAIILSCHNAAPSATIREIRAYLRELMIGGNGREAQGCGRPGGPRGYAWFAGVLAARFGGEAPKVPEGRPPRELAAGATV